MYVCICEKVTEREIRSFITKSDRSTLEDVQKNCCAGIHCGKCIEQIREILEEAKAKNPGTEDTL